MRSIEMQCEQTSLERARRHMVESENRVSDQQALVQTMKAKGLDATRAVQLLDYFRRLHVLAQDYVAHEEIRAKQQGPGVRDGS